MSAIRDPIYEPQQFKPDPRTAFGPILSAFEVEHAISRTVARWICDYLAETERQRGLPAGAIPVFRSISVAGFAERWPEDQLPALMIASPGLDTPRGRIEVRGDGEYIGRFRIECTSEVSARGNRQAIMLARLYASAVRGILIQPGGTRAMRELLAPAQLRRVELVGEDYNVRDWTTERTRCAAVVRTIVEVAGIVNRQMGPTEPACPDPQLEGEVLSKHILVEKEEEPNA